MPDESSRQVHERFGRAAKHYEQHAVVQKQSAMQMGHRIAERFQASELRAGLELGCGTGFLTRELVSLFPNATWMVTDISPQMLAECRLNVPRDPSVSFQILDGNHVDAGTDPFKSMQAFDLICSNLTFQWFQDLPKTVGNLSDLLANGGQLIFNVLGSGSFQPWRWAYEQNSDAPQPPQFLSKSSVEACLLAALEQTSANLKWQTHVTTIKQTHNGLRGFFKSLKQIGANTNVWNAEAEQTGARFRWLRHASQEPVTMNYEIINVEVQRTDGV